VQQDAAVVEAYLGRDETAAASAGIRP
jgi:hypothetical protein